MIHPSIWFRLSAVVLTLAVTACTLEPTTGQFLGDVGNGESQVGVALGATSVTVYVVGLGDKLAETTRFFEAEVDGDRTWSTTTDGWLLTGYEERDGVFGELTDPDGGLFPYNATRPIDISSADGVYSADEGGCRAGALVFNSGGQAEGAYCPAAGEIVPITEAVVTPTSAEMTAEGAGGPVTFTMTRVEPG